MTDAEDAAAGRRLVLAVKRAFDPRHAGFGSGPEWNAVEAWAEAVPPCKHEWVDVKKEHRRHFFVWIERYRECELCDERREVVGA